LEAIFLLPNNPGGHATYQVHVTTNLRKYYPNPSSLSNSTWDILERYYLLDLSETDIIMKDRYSIFGPKPRLPSCMLRSYLLSIEFKIFSITDWVAALKSNPLYAIISGFDFGDSPGIGTFYDFFDRLWLSDDDNFLSHLRPPKKKEVAKPELKGAKAASVNKVTVEELIKQLELDPISTEQPYSLLFNVYKEQFLDVSVKKGLISSEALSLSGDGTPVYTTAKERKKRICDCFTEKGVLFCDCDRYFSQPDCNIGWDSHRECFFFGYNLYLFTASDSINDLPVFPFLNPASEHDSIAFVYSLFTFKSFLRDYHVHKIILDSAHDAMSIYKYCGKNNITPFIDLNDERGAKAKYKDDLLIDSDGIPFCPAGLKMRRNGKDLKNYRLKFRCPLTDRKNGCKCLNPCSDAKYGRNVHLNIKDNPRLFNIPERGSNEWKDEYNARTSSERANKRIKIDFSLENGNHRSSKMWYCRLYCIMMLQHLNAWGLCAETPLKSLVTEAD
jgi:hypothetical protein